MSERPRIAADNYEAVYDYYETNRRNERFNTMVYHAGHRLLDPEVVIAPETRERLAQAVEEGKGVIAVANHPSQHDVFTLSAAMTEFGIDELYNFTGLAKSELFQNPITLPIFEFTGCVPAFRRKSDAVYDREQHLARTARLHQLLVNRLQRGEHVAILPEGTRSDPTNYEHVPLDRVKAGVAHLALATAGESVILPFGVHYDTPRPRRTLPKRHAAVTFGPLIEAYAPTVNGVREQVHTSINDALARSVARHQS